jgi:hypothetical protein
MSTFSRTATSRVIVRLPVLLQGEEPMGGVIYLVGLIVVVMFILSLLGLR